MSSLSISRAVLRQSTKLPGRSARRFESTTTTKATEAVKDAAVKASGGVSRVTSAAGPALAGAAKGVANALGKIGGRTGKLIAFVERMYHLSSGDRFLACVGFWGLNG